MGTDGYLQIWFQACVWAYGVDIHVNIGTGVYLIIGVHARVGTFS